jgi:hypothetical protein
MNYETKYYSQSECDNIEDFLTIQDGLTTADVGRIFVYDQ